MSISKGCKYQEYISEGIKGELHHQYRHDEYSFSSFEEYCTTSFLKGKNNIAIFSEGCRTKIILFLRVSKNKC